MQCTICHKQYTKKTLDKYRGLYCKPCFFDILIKENHILQCDNSNLNTKISSITNENISLQKEVKDLSKNTIIIYYDDNIIKYKGQMKGDYYHGYGIYYDKKGNMVYKGLWNNNNYHAKGTLYHKNGNIKYDGDLEDNKYHGKGKYYYENGDIKYDGDLEEDKKHGKGKYYYENGNILYEGDLEKDKPHGKGKYYHKNGHIEYEGDYKEGKRYGKGKYYHKNGHIKYDGDFEDNEKHGKGILYDENGTIDCEGEWINGEYQLNEEDACVICYSYKKTYAFIPCGHLCICSHCVKKYEGDKCIICRTEFSIPHKIFN